MTTHPTYRPRRFGVIGAGPVGAVVAAFLANGGYEVTLCDVVPTLLGPAIDPGIVIEGSDAVRARVAKTVSRVADLTSDPPEVTIVTVKATALPLVASALQAVVREGGYVVSWQNGIDTELVLVEKLGRRQVMRGVVNLGCVLLGPAHVRLTFHHRPHYLQELDPGSKNAAMGICHVFTACGLTTEHTDHIASMVWRKAVSNASASALCAMTGMTLGEIAPDPTLFGLFDALLKEGIAVARANEIVLGPNFYEECIGYVKSAGQHKPSMLQDIETGRPTEIDFINGKLAEYGARAGMPTPYNTMARGLIKTLERGQAALRKDPPL